MANGYWQKLLRVDLSIGKYYVEDISEDELKDYIGGAGLGGSLLYREVPEKISAYDPENKIIFATGPFQGPAIPGGAKFSIVGISPLTNTFADTAAGASFGPGLKDAGYDVLIVQGCSKTPVYLHILDDKVEIIDASWLMGMDAYETVDAIHKKHEDKKLSISCIGQAGENQVAIACIVVDKHSFAGRCGLGAVMGSKNIKAVAVRGTRNVPVHNPEQAKKLMQQFSKEIAQEVKDNGFREHATPSLCIELEELGDMPIKYWSGDRWPEGAAKLGAPNYTKTLNAKPYPCKFCPVGCHRKISISQPAEYCLEGPGPEYEALGMMGTNLLIDDPKAVAKANDLANRMGMDCISTGAMIGFAIECYEKGLINYEDTGGLELKWGDPDILIELTKQIGEKRDFGSVFAEGTLFAAHKIGQGSQEIVAHVKGLDLAAHDARACFSLAPSYATATRGACHFRGGCEDIEMGGFYIPEIGIEEGFVEFFKIENQSLLAIKAQDFFGLLNSLVLCDFMVDGGGLNFSKVQELFNAITGWDYSIDDLMTAGERGFTLQRLINIRDGYSIKTDKLPQKMFKPAQEGHRAGQIPPFKELMEDYYRIRGWDHYGFPKDATLKRLGI